VVALVDHVIAVDVAVPCLLYEKSVHVRVGPYGQKSLKRAEQREEWLPDVPGQGHLSHGVLDLVLSVLVDTPNKATRRSRVESRPRRTGVVLWR
jgi:hypothetical protein